MIDLSERLALWFLPISPAAKVIAALIVDTQGLERGRCDMSLETIAYKTRLSRSGVVRGLRELRAWGLSETTQRGCPTWRVIDTSTWSRAAGGPCSAPEPPAPPEPPVAQVDPSHVTDRRDAADQTRATGGSGGGSPADPTRATGGSRPEPPVTHKKREQKQDQKRELEANAHTRARETKDEGPGREPEPDPTIGREFIRAHAAERWYRHGIEAFGGSVIERDAQVGRDTGDFFDIGDRAFSLAEKRNCDPDEVLETWVSWWLTSAQLRAPCFWKQYVSERLQGRHGEYKRRRLPTAPAKTASTLEQAVLAHTDQQATDQRGVIDLADRRAAMGSR